jgi:hypothetical protein
MNNNTSDQLNEIRRSLTRASIAIRRSGDGMTAEAIARVADRLDKLAGYPALNR